VHGIPSARILAGEISKKVVGLTPQVRQIAARLTLHLTRAQLLREGKALDTPNEAIFLLGSSGTGKTFVFDVACTAAGLPHATYSAQELTRTGFVGANVTDEPFHALAQAADMDVERARYGAVCLDEWKVAEVVGDTAGVGTVGVQQGVLPVMVGSEFMVGGKRGAWGGFRPFKFNSLGTCFFFAGHLPGLPARLERRRAGGIGFSPASSRSGDAALRECLLEAGFIEEWLNRLSLCLVLPDPSLESLRQSMSRPFIDRTWNTVLERRGLSISLTSAAVKLAAEYSLESRMFFRGPRSIVGSMVQELVASDEAGNVRLPASVTGSPTSRRCSTRRRRGKQS